MASSGKSGCRAYAKSRTQHCARKQNVCSKHLENSIAYPDRVRWSHEGLPEDWLEDDYIDVKGGGSGINGLAVVQGQLVIFKTNAIYLLVGNGHCKLYCC
jgi:hypothetical protein